MYQIRETVFRWDIQTQRRVENTTCSGVYMTKFEIADETLFRVFDISSKSKQKLRSTQRIKIIRIYMYANWDQVFKLVVIFFALTWWIIKWMSLRISKNQTNRASCILKATVVECWSILDLNRHSINILICMPYNVDISIKTRSTLDQHLSLQ